MTAPTRTRSATVGDGPAGTCVRQCLTDFDCPDAERPACTASGECGCEINGDRPESTRETGAGAAGECVPVGCTINNNNDCAGPFRPVCDTGSGECGCPKGNVQQIAGLSETFLAALDAKMATWCVAA